MIKLRLFQLVTALVALAVCLIMLNLATLARASTYAVFIPLDDQIYDELDTLDGLGLLDSYLPEVKPISRVEAARLVIEADTNIAQVKQPDPLAVAVLDALHSQLALEVGWLNDDHEDGLPSMVRPVQRMALQYVYSSGARREFYVENEHPVTVDEATPLLPGNSDLPSASGSNGTALWSGWAGFGSFLTGYAEGAYGGPLRTGPQVPGRDRIVDGAAVVSLGNLAISYGNEQMQWGVGYYGQLSQSTNASAFPALRFQNIHPGHLPGFLRYLGLMRYNAFLGQLDADRVFAHPWITGQIIALKPLPDLELGVTHAIEFGGRGNDNYGIGGFFGRATGIDTGNSLGANTNSRVSVYTKLRFPSLRGAELYGEILGEDFYQPFGKSLGIKLPFKSPSYTLGLYIPRLTRGGLTDGRLEWTLTDRNYSIHSDSLYWANDGVLMGYPLGPGAQRFDWGLGHWFTLRYKLESDLYYEFRQPLVPADSSLTERGGGFRLGLTRLPFKVKRLQAAIADFELAAAVEYVSHLNYLNADSTRVMMTLSIGLAPPSGVFTWR
ncbi:MAG TPA: capsule assembly Wzi family protein [Candidatus Binataceae bacterium]|nr:capsule assembly Wzi family protein [Candidatus Binataceae bacterium]